MKIESFEIRNNQYLCVVADENKAMIRLNLSAYKAGITISEDKKTLWLNESREKYETIKADFDLSLIAEAWELANL